MKINLLHYPSLELCKKLTEIGFPETELNLIDSRKQHKRYNCPPVDEYEDFVFVPFWNLYTWAPELDIEPMDESNIHRPNLRCPSVMELLDMMPPFINVWERNLFDLEIVKQGKQYLVRYLPSLIFNRDEYLLNTKTIQISEIPPNALAEMVLWLYENKYISFTK